MVQSKTNLQDETFIAGDSKELFFQFKNSQGKPIDLTLFTVQVKIAPYGEKSYAILTKDGVLDNDPKTGKFSIKLTPTDTQFWEEGYYVFQAIATQGEFNTAKAEGKWYVKGAIL